MSTVKIGHASIDENGETVNGSAGDQNKKELCKRDWYDKGWNKLIRAKDEAVAEKIATFCEEACGNDNIGYDQNQRLTLNTEAKAVNHVLSNIKAKCECDCSSLMAECAIAAGIDVSPAVTTRNMTEAFKATGKFEILTEDKYIGGSGYLQRGDILVKEGSHTVCVLTNSSKISDTTVTTSKKEFFPMYIGTSASLVDAFASLKIDSSLTYRKKIATTNGISKYTGTAEQNTQILKILKKGTLIKPQ